MNVEQALKIITKSAKGETVELNALILAKLVMLEQRANVQGQEIVELKKALLILRAGEQHTPSCTCSARAGESHKVGCFYHSCIGCPH